MENREKKTVTVETTVQLPPGKVWDYWTKPEHITQWNYALDTWHCPAAENDLRNGGRFSARMEARDGSMGFDYAGEYDLVSAPRKLLCTLDDGRRVNIEFISMDQKTIITETFEVEDTHTLEQQKMGWQAILDNFKKYAESREQ